MRHATRTTSAPRAKGTAILLALGMTMSGCGGDAAPRQEADGHVASAHDGSVVELTDASSGADADTGGSATRDATAPPPEDAGEPRFEPEHFDVNHVLATGQSLSVGAIGTPALSLAPPPYPNWMPDTGVRGPMTDPQPDFTSFVPLAESEVETMASGFAHLVSELAQDDLAGLEAPRDQHRILVSGHGINGSAYDVLRKGGTSLAFANGIRQVREAQRVATAMGLSYGVRAVTNVHGESDHLDRTTNYAALLAIWQADYESEVFAITGQRGTLPMIHSQFSSWTRWGDATSDVVIAQLAASVADPDRLPLVGPKYFLPYVDDGIHLTNEGYRWMGEYYAKVYRQIVILGRRWEPLRPSGASVEGALITLEFHVPAPPLVLDTALVSDPGHLGFEYAEDDERPPTIVEVTLASPTAVAIRLSAPPTGRNRRIRYAYTGVPGARAGSTSGPRGNLRDSDDTPSRHGRPLYNWAVHFDFSLP